MTDRELRRKRDQMIEKAGGGMWRNKATDEWCHVDVTFYPRTKLWITEKGERRETTRSELEKDYAQLET